jgi:tetratricopeptide (TPR) repeat protein
MFNTSLISYCKLILVILSLCCYSNRVISQETIASPEDARKIILELNKNYEFNHVQKLINETAIAFPCNHVTLSLLADWEYHTMNYQEADFLYSEVLLLNPEYIDALTGKAQVFLDLKEYDSSLYYYNKALAVDSNNVKTLLNYSKYLLQSSQPNEYLEIISKVFKIDSTNSDALSGLGFYMCRYQYDNENGAKYLNKAIELNPFNRKAHHYLGRGSSPGNYENENKLANKELLIIDSFLTNNLFELAFEKANKRYLADTSDFQALKFVAACNYHNGNYYECINNSFMMLEMKPNYGLSHYFIAESLRKLKNEHNVLINKRNKIFSNKSTTKEIPYLREVFINFDKCEEPLQKNILLNTEPISGFLEPLSIAGSTVYFMDFHHLLWNCPYLEYTKGTRTVDLRLSDDLKGQGRNHTTSNKVQQTANNYGSYNVAFHEIGHLIHWLFTSKQINELKQLFIKAKEGKYTLDWYADMNEREYFAQGVEAWLSDYKLPGQQEAFCHTKNDLLELDPELYEFIVSLFNQNTYEDNIIQAYIVKSYSSNTLEESLEFINSALIKHPGNTDLLNELGVIYRENGDYGKAIETHQEIISTKPDYLNSYVELAFDLNMQNEDISEPIQLLEEIQNHRDFTSEMCNILGYFYIENKNYKQAEKILNKAIKLDPYPDPYNLRIYDSYYLLSKAQLMLGSYSNAEQNILKSLAINNNNAEALADMAFVLSKQNKHKESNNYIKRAEHIDANNKRVIEIKNKLNDNQNE